MTQITQHAIGTFCWPELATGDPAGARSFYTALFGWSVNERDLGGGEFYYMLQHQGESVGAFYRMPDDQKAQGVPPHWMSYVSVADVDQIAAKVETLGGQLLAAPFDVFDAGRMAVAQDPLRATFALWQARKHPGAGVVNETGSMCWNELMTRDVERCKTFYTQLVGWKAEPWPGPVEYTVFKAGETMAGGMMAITPEMGDVPPHWMIYFAVDDCDRSAGKAKELGGRVLHGPTDIPGVGRFAVLMDPQGAVFSIIRMTGSA